MSFAIGFGLLIYIIYRFTGLKKLSKRIEILEKRADKLEKEVRKLMFDLLDK